MKKENCAACGFSYKPEDQNRINSHHMRPTAHGGSDEADNKILLCPTCHSIAHALLDKALGAFGAIDIYKLYSRNHLVMEIQKYRDIEIAVELELETWIDKFIAFILKPRLKIRIYRNYQDYL